MTQVLPAGRKQLHIDKAAMASKAAPPIMVRTERGSMNVRQAHILGESWFVYDPEHPLPETGTYAWVETYAAVEVWP